MTSSTETKGNFIELPSGAGSGSKFHVDKRGQGDELIIFLHAVGGDSTSWEPQMERFAGEYTCLSYDLRGHGLSKVAPSSIESEINIECFAQDTISLIGKFAFTKAHLVGLSMGGVVALEVFKQRPDLIQSLTLANTWCYLEDKKERIAFMEDSLSKRSLMESSKALIPDLFGPDATKEMKENAISVEGTKDKEVFLASWRSMFDVDYREMLSRINVPLLLIGGAFDQVTPSSPLLTSIHKEVITSQLVEIERAGHFSNLDSASEFNKYLSIHLRRARRFQGSYIGKREVKKRTMKGEIVAHGLLDILNEREIRYFFSNSGTDFTPIIDAFALFRDRDDFELKPVVAPHENTAIAMAHGYFLKTGKPQVVMGHVNVGTANMGLGLINANRARVPVLVLSGNTPWYDSGMDGCRTNFVQWGQDTFDQSAYFREFTKWDYELKGPHDMEVVVDRGLAIAKSDPAGPVYLTLPKEPLCMKLPETELSARPVQAPAFAGQPAPELVAQAGRMIASAKKPLIITSELGRYPGGVEALVQLASNYAIPVIEHGKKNFFNFPTESPFHFGFDPSPYVEEADLVVSIECHVPWIPALSKVESPPEMIHIGVDPLCEKLPMRAFPSVVNLSGSPALTIDALSKVLACLGASETMSANEFYRRKAKRAIELKEEHDRLFGAKRSQAKADESSPEITKSFLSYAISQVVDDRVVIFNEYNLDPYQVKRHLPDTWFENSVASGLGWSLGAALGAQLASPDETMLVTLGDGSYMFNTPLSFHYVASAYELPVVVVVFNDNAWSTIKKSYKGSMPDGWGVKKNHMPLTDFAIPVEFEKLAEATGGVGLRVEKSSDLIKTLQEAISISRGSKKHVLVNVICRRDG